MSTRGLLAAGCCVCCASLSLHAACCLRQGPGKVGRRAVPVCMLPTAWAHCMPAWEYSGAAAPDTRRQQKPALPHLTLTPTHPPPYHTRSFAKLLDLVEERAVVVLPAFETSRQHELMHGQGLAEYAITLDKQQLRDQLYHAGDVAWFQQHDYRWGHASTNYYEW